MIISSKNPADRAAMFAFMRMNGVPLLQTEDFMALGRLNGQGRLIGVVAFNGFVGKTAWMHAAGVGNWISRDFLIQAFHYPFVQLKLKYLFAVVAGDNPRALEFDRHMGFQDWETLPDGADEDIPLHILRMTREECRWTHPEIVQRLQRKVVVNG